jgi:hypothetical protein
MILGGKKVRKAGANFQAKMTGKPGKRKGKSSFALDGEVRQSLLTF